MPQPLRDPRRLGGHTLTGAYPPGDRSSVYETSDGALLTLFHTRLADPDAFLERIDRLQRAGGYPWLDLIDAGTANGEPYVVVEKVDGAHLDGPLPESALQRLAIASMTGLAGLHREDVAHGSFTPWSVILTGAGPRLALLDLDALVAEGATKSAPDADKPTGRAPHAAAETPDPDATARVTARAAEDVPQVDAPAVADPDATTRVPKTAPRLAERVTLWTAGDPDATSQVRTVVRPDLLDEARPVDSLAYLPPEVLRPEPAPPAPPGDLFAWAAVMVFAATGRRAFERDSRGETIYAVLHDDPDLDGLPEGLAGVAAACFAKDPGQRPTAQEALERLIGEAQLTIDRATLEAVRNATVPRAAPPAEEQETEPAVAPPPARKNLRWAAIIAAAVAIVLVAGLGGYLLGGNRTGAATTPAAATGIPSTSVSTLAAADDPSPPPLAVGDFTAPGPAIKLLENPADPARLTGYRKGADTWVRTEGDTFTQLPMKDAEPARSPGGRWLAAVGPETITFTGAGEPFTVTPGVPYTRPTWSRDGAKLMLTMTAGDEALPAGFVIVDVATRAVTTVDTDDETTGGEDGFAWLPDGSGVAVGYRAETARGIRFRDLTGRQTKAFHWVGETYGRRMFSPSGKTFVTFCPSGGTYCVWDTTTGVRQASIPLFYADGLLYGWYDDAHLIVADPQGDPHRIVAMDLRGRPQRVLAEIQPKDDTTDLLLYYTGN
ncbi:hypothetical protein [Herbidospora mongoliensis]|uniref:hypothetical protein n=1 Tax=Herbidospora mongoliensis TaxID=688067 RepID=UPI0008326DB2|nr:hypothetical protein [Herbidospora mongoliensis]